MRALQIGSVVTALVFFAMPQPAAAEPQQGGLPALAAKVAVLTGVVGGLANEVVTVRKELRRTNEVLAKTQSDLAQTQMSLMETSSALEETQSSLAGTQSELIATRDSLQEQIAEQSTAIDALSIELTAALDEQDAKTLAAVSALEGRVPSKAELREGYVTKLDASEGFVTKDEAREDYLGKTEFENEKAFLTETLAPKADLEAFRGSVAEGYAPKAELETFKSDVTTNFAPKADLEAFRGSVAASYAPKAELETFKSDVTTNFAPKAELESTKQTLRSSTASGDTTAMHAVSQQMQSASAQNLVMDFVGGGAFLPPADGAALLDSMQGTVDAFRSVASQPLTEEAALSGGCRAAADRASAAIEDARSATQAGVPVSYTMVADYVIGEILPLQQNLTAAAEGLSDGSEAFVLKQQRALTTMSRVCKTMQDTNVMMAMEISR